MTIRGLCLLLILAPVHSREETPVKPETATPIEICATCKDVSIPLVPDDKTKINLNEIPVVEFVFLGSAPRNAKKFTATWSHDAEKFPRAIDIHIDDEETKQAGTYDIWVNLQPKSIPGAQRLLLHLIRPAATAENISKFIIERTYWFIGLKCDTHPRLVLSETSNKTGITITAARPLSNSSIGTRPIGGTIDINPKDQPEVTPGTQVDLKYSLNGNFELGTATGTYRLNAPQLAAPISFDFEVHSRVHWIYIGITIAVGLIFSWFIKVWLQQNIEFDQAHLDAQKLLDGISQEATLHADPAFAAAYQPQLIALTKVMNGNSATDINTAKTALDTAWKSALQTFQKKHQDQLDALEKLSDVTQFDWLVPPAVAQAVTAARTAQRDVVQMIDRDDLTAADACRQRIIFDLGTQILSAALDWQSNQQLVLQKLQAGPPGISAAITAALSKPVNDLQGSLQKVNSSTNLSTPEQIQQTLSDLRFESVSVQQFFNWLGGAIQMELADAEGQIPNAPPPAWDARIFAAVPTAVAAFASFLSSLVDRPDAINLTVQLNLVQTAWSAGLQGQFTAPDARVQAQLDARDYVHATQTAFQRKTAPPAIASLAGAGHGGPGFIPPEFQRDVIGAAMPPVYANRTRIQTVLMRAPAVRTAVTDAAKLKREKSIQSLVIGLILIVAGYGLQLNTFVGTFTDFSTLFFWAFALDLTVDQIGKIAKKS
jgi:hypothetical protein